MSQKLNVILVTADRMRFCDVGFMGNSDVDTPNLDETAANGVVFQNAFSTCPICTPYRAAVLTGRYPHASGVFINDTVLPDDTTTLPRILRSHGYRTGFVGKWHLNGFPRFPGFVPPGPDRLGFDDFWAANECNHDYYNGHYFRDDDEPIEYQRYAPEVETDLAVEFINQDTASPFFLWLSWAVPHAPIPSENQPAPRRLIDKYHDREITLRNNVPYRWADEAEAQYRRNYAMIEALDRQFGRLLAALEDLQIADNTVVIFTSDHGDLGYSHSEFAGQPLPRHNCLQMPWDECTRVPMMAHCPEFVAAGEKSPAFINAPDIAPTILSLCGVAESDNMQGCDMAKAFRTAEQQPSRPQSAFLQSPLPCHGRFGHQPWRAVRTSEYLYARYPDGPWLLYDLQNDPGQMENPVNDAEYDAVRENMQDLLDRWCDDLSDTFHDRATMLDTLQPPKIRAAAAFSQKLHPAKVTPADTDPATS